MVRSERLTVQVTPGLGAEVRHAAVAERCSMSDIVYRAVLDWAYRRVAEHARMQYRAEKLESRLSPRLKSKKTDYPNLIYYDRPLISK